MEARNRELEAVMEELMKTNQKLQRELKKVELVGSEK
jgi:hypothetical protein